MADSQRAYLQEFAKKIYLIMINTIGTAKIEVR